MPSRPHALTFPPARTHRLSSPFAIDPLVDESTRIDSQEELIRVSALGLCSHGLYTYDLYSHGLYSHGPHSYGLYSHGLLSSDRPLVDESSRIAAQERALVRTPRLFGAFVYS